MEGSTKGRRARRVLLISLSVLLALGGYLYYSFRNMTPVTTEEAIERFDELNDGVTSEAYEVEPASRREKKRADGKSRTEAGRRKDKRSEAGTIAGPGAESAATNPESDDEIGPVTAHSYDVVPAEGVYRYIGKGEEEFNGWRRPFPSNETHRLVVHEGKDSWTEHHIFSKQRESWTRHTTYPKRRVVHSQRNLIEIGPRACGPCTRDTLVPFNPPIVTTLFPGRVGARWTGEFEGRTDPEDEDYTATYTNRVVSDEIWNVGGQSVRVVGHDLDIEFEGELSAQVTVDYWYAPSLGITVREDYTMDATASGLRYEAEWTVRLLSLFPER